MSCAGLLLAAGASRRFGPDNKLLSDLHGRPLVCYAANALRESQADILIAVTQAPDIARLLEGFDIVPPDIADPQHADSLRAGVRHAKTLGASKLVIVLGDMPFVTPALVDAVLAACSATTPSAAIMGQQKMPPAAFPTSFFDRLAGLTGDQGAGRLLSDLPCDALVPARQEELFDVDTTEALATAQRMAWPV